MTNRPRKGQYELFLSSNSNLIYCFDDLDQGAVWHKQPEMIEWLNRQDPKQCRNFENIAYYVTPKLYLMWKLTWNEFTI